MNVKTYQSNAQKKTTTREIISKNTPDPIVWVIGNNWRDFTISDWGFAGTIYTELKSLGHIGY